MVGRGHLWSQFSSSVCFLAWEATWMMVPFADRRGKERRVHSSLDSELKIPMRCLKGDVESGFGCVILSLIKGLGGDTLRRYQHNPQLTVGSGWLYRKNI